MKQVKFKMPDLILGRGKTKTVGKGFWGKDNCMAGQTKEFKWLNSDLKNPFKYAASNAK